MPTWTAAWTCTSPATFQRQLEKSADSFTRVRQLRRLLHDDAEKSKPLLSRHIGQLILNPKETPEGPVYEVSGDMDLLPARSDVMQVVARAGSRSQCYRRGQRPRGERAGIGLGQIFYGPSIETMYNKPGLPPNGDPRTPDIIVQPNPGVVYTGSHKKHSEHGGFAQDDTHVMILVSNPGWEAQTVTSFVETTQVAATILQALGLDPGSLDAVQKEGTPVLPEFGFK